MKKIEVDATTLRKLRDLAKPSQLIDGSGKSLALIFPSLRILVANRKSVKWKLNDGSEKEVDDL
jgi:hypothetical protein